MPLVSVIIPTFNREASIMTALDSVLRQSVSDIEVIVVDDCSVDATMDILKTIDDPRLRIVRHDQNSGGSAARNTGIREARADLVAFQDSDDEWLPRKLELQLAALERAGRDAIGVYCGMIVVGSPSQKDYDPTKLAYLPKPRRLPMEGHLRETMLREGSIISTQTFVGKRRVLREAGGFDEELSALQDWDCFLRIASMGTIAFVPEPLVLQRFSPNSLTRSVENRLLALQTIVKKHEADLIKMPSALASYYYRIGGGYRQLGKFDKAEIFFRKSINVRHFDIKSWINIILIKTKIANLIPK